MRIVSSLSIILMIFLSISSLFLSSVSFAKTDNVSKVFKLMEKKKWEDSYNLATENKNLPLQKIVLSQQFLDNKHVGNDFEKITKFLQENPNWPENYLLKLRAESYIDSSTNKELIVKWFQRNTPLTSRGYKYYALAASSIIKDQKKLKNIIKAGWHNGCFSLAEQKIYHKKFKSYLNEQDHVKKIDNHLWNNEITAAKNSLYLVNNAYKRSFKTQIAFIKKQKNANKLLKKVLTKTHTAGLIYRYLEFCKNNLPSGSRILSILHSTKIDKKYADKFWQIQAYLAREYIEKKRYNDAYKVATSCFTNNPANKSNAEYLSGWLALRFLNKPKLALKHFRNFNRIVKTPISRSRGIYWLARTHEIEKNLDKADRLYKIAASDYPHTFYGQMALAELGRNKIHLPDNIDLKQYKGAANVYAKKNDILQAAKIISKYGSNRLSQIYIASSVAQAKNDLDVLHVAYNINQLQNIHHMAWMAKSALQKHVFIKNHAYPAPYKITNSDIEKSLIYSVIRQESVFDQNAISSAQARGLMQVIEKTAFDTAKKIAIPYDLQKLTTDPYYNITIGSAYLQQMLEQYKGSYILAIAAYNAGPHNVDKWLEIYDDPRKMQNVKNILDWIELIPYYETRNYVQRVLENLQIYRTIINKDNKFNLTNDLLRKEEVSMNELKIGDKAPEFSVSIAENKSLALKDLRGKYVVLYFYPKDSTPGCTIEAKDFNSHLDEFDSLNTKVIGISKDDLKSHDKFRNKYDLKFALGSDADVKLCKDYGVWTEKSMFGKKYMGITRATFLIDPKGKIAYIWPKVSVMGHASDVIKKLKELQK